MRPAPSHGKAIASTVVALLLLPAVLLALAPAAGAEDSPASPWEGRVRIDNGPAKDRSIASVALATGAPGELYAAWLEDRGSGNDCFAAASDDGGQTWSSDVQVNPIDIPVRPWNGSCDIEADANDHVWVVYSERVSNGWQVKFTRSDNNAASFRAPSFINAVSEGETQRYPTIARTAAGAIAILFLHRSATSSRLLLSIAEDGLNPGIPRQLDPNAPLDEQHVRGDIAVAPGGGIVVAYGFKTPGIAGIKLATRAPGASTFTITTLYTITELVPRELSPRVAVSSTGVVEVAFDRGSSGGIMHVRSNDGGATLENPTRVWIDPDGEANTDPALAFDSLGVLHIAFTRQNASKPRVLHTYTADGETFTAPVEVGADWNVEDEGARGAEGPSDIATITGGSLATAYAAARNNTYGVRASWWTNLPPVVTIETPGEGDTVRDTVSVQGTALDPGGVSGIARVFVKMGDVGPVQMPGSTSWSHDFDTTTMPDGPVTVEAWAADGFIEGAHVTMKLNVDNNQPPELDMRDPVDDSHHRGTVRVMGYATDDLGFREDWKVQWRVEEGNWTDLGYGTLIDPLNVSFDRMVDLSHLDNGQYYFSVRVTDGVKWSVPWIGLIFLENRPDLRINASRIEWTPAAPRQGEKVTITAYVENVGARLAPRGLVDFRIGPKVLAEIESPNVDPGKQAPLVFFWNATEGTYTFTIRLDPRADLQEADETNNDAAFEMVVAKAAEPEKDFPWLIVGIIIAIVLVVVVALVYIIRLRATDVTEETEVGHAETPPPKEKPRSGGEGEPSQEGGPPPT